MWNCRSIRIFIEKVMAEVSQNSTTAGGKPRVKKFGTRIDMTPMVDLAFLLLTFFILTTTMLKSTILQLDMPERSGDISLNRPISEKNILYVILGESNKIYWLKGDEKKISRSDYSRRGIRNVVQKQHRINPNIYIIIKPMPHSKYENLVDILDEIQIAQITRYSIAEFEDADAALLASVR